MTGSITSADAVFTLAVKTLFNTPIILENWSANKAWEGSDITLADARMSLDGKLNKAFKIAPIGMTLTLQPNSSSWAVFEAIQTASRQARTVYELNGELRLPSLKRKYTLVSGIIASMSALPDGSSLLGERSVKLLWEDILPSGI